MDNDGARPAKYVTKTFWKHLSNRDLTSLPISDIIEPEIKLFETRAFCVFDSDLLGGSQFMVVP